MSWRLWRQDDNGNRFLVGEWEQRDAAERRMEELSRYPHKQIYWIERCGDGRGHPGTSADECG